MSSKGYKQRKAFKHFLLGIALYIFSFLQAVRNNYFFENYIKLRSKSIMLSYCVVLEDMIGN